MANGKANLMGAPPLLRAIMWKKVPGKWIQEGQAKTRHIGNCPECHAWHGHSNRTCPHFRERKKRAGPEGPAPICASVRFSRQSVVPQSISSAPPSVFVSQVLSVHVLGALPAFSASAEFVEIQLSGGSDIDAYLYKPSGKGPYPAVIVLHH